MPAQSHAQDSGFNYWDSWNQQMMEQNFARQQEDYDYIRELQREMYGPDRLAAPPPSQNYGGNPSPNMNEYIMETGCDQYWPLCRNRWQ